MSTPPKTQKNMDDIVALCRRRGFIWQSSEIYGGINGFWDYGPLGAELKRNLKNAWHHDIIRCPPPGPDGKPIRIVPLDTTIIMHPKVWEASGHVAGFNDPRIDCRACQGRFRADHLYIQKWVETEKYGEFFGETPDLPELRHRSTEGQKQELNLYQLKFKKYENTIGTVVNYLVEASSTEEAESMALPARERKQVEKMGLELIFAIPLSDYDYALPPDAGCPNCGERGTLTAPRLFNLMFETYVGAVQDEESKAYLRPETAQGIFTQFWNVVDTSRVKVPFGIAQTGKAFRNEVTPRNFTFRSREFEQMEIEFFCHPSDAADWYEYWRDRRYQWWLSIGLSGGNLQLRAHSKDELAHYAKDGAGTSDIEYRFPFTAPGFGELEGVAHRSDFDLRAHATACGKGDKMMYFDQEANERYFPHVIEPSAGADRGVLAVLCEAYTPDESRPSKVFMKFHPRMAPIKAGIFPLVNKDGMPEVAEKLYLELRKKYAVEYDPKQNIGKRYARMDEAGTPYCFTVDGDTLKDQTVTVRDRDTQEQQRINIGKVQTFLDERMM